jgi:hypothetical protein
MPIVAFLLHGQPTVFDGLPNEFQQLRLTVLCIIASAPTIDVVDTI